MRRCLGSPPSRSLLACAPTVGTTGNCYLAGTDIARASGPGDAPRALPNSAAEIPRHPRARIPGDRPLSRPVQARQREDRPVAAGQPLSAPAAGSPRPGPATCCCGSARGSALRAGTPRRLARARAGVWSRLWRRGRRDPSQRTLYLRAQSTRCAAVSHADTRNANGAAEPLRPRSAAIGRDVPKGRRGDAVCSCRSHAGPETPRYAQGRSLRQEADADSAEAGEVD